MLRCKPPARLNAQARHGEPSIWALKPVAQAIALLLVAGSAQAQTAFSAGWFADKGAAQAASAGQPGVQLPGMPPPLAQQQQANQQLQRSLANFNNSVAAIAAQQAAQAAGRQAALARLPTVPDGLGEGGLKVDTGLTQGWLNAKAPVQTQADGKTTVTITQTADKAILNWETFNVGRNTTVDFSQQSNWAVLNRINDPQSRPSEIQGQIKGNGTVMLVNRNGVIFSGTSQVNVRNLVAAAANISDSQFSKGLYVDSTGTQPTFTDAVGQIQVERGAQIQTLNPATSTDSGGYALLLGSEVLNDGSLVTPNGQVTLAAGDNFYIRQGLSTAGNPRSTTRGNEVASTLNSGSRSGTVINSGLITASTGDITLTGHQVLQNGVIASSTSTNTRGTVHLLNSAGDSTGSITLGTGSTTAILLDASTTGLDSQRAAALAALNGSPSNLITGKFDNLSSVVDRIEQSRVEIVSGGTVDFQNGSLTLATGGQVAVSAGQRSLVRDGSIIDVSGAVGVKVAMEANSIKVNVQGNELRDASGNRDAGKLSSSDVWVDVRDLVYVPAGTDGYPTARWYTAGGLLEVSGYLGTQGHGVGEWMAQGGTLTFTGKDVVTQQGAQINLSGGTLDVQSGYIKQTWLTGSDGRLYELSSAPGDLLYTGVYKGFADTSVRWGQTDYYYNPLIAPRQRYELGYTVGRDAGNLVISTGSAVLEGQVIGDVYQGPQQNQAANPTLDGYQQSQTAVARRAQLIAGTYTPIYDPIAGVVNYNLGASLNQVSFAANPTAIAAGVDLGSVVPVSRQGTLVLDTNQLNGFQLGAIKVAAKQQIEVDNNLSVTNGGTITLYGPQVTVNADLTARGGTLQLGNVLNQIDPNQSFKLRDTLIAAPGSSVASTTVAAGVTLNTAGLWTNQLLDSTDNQGLPYVNGGLVSLRSSGNLSLQAGSLIDVSSGAVLQANGKLLGGKGGSLILAANAGGFGVGGVLSLGGDIRAVGVNGGGTLTLQSSQVVIGTPTTPVSGAVELDGDFFKQGFSAYDITGNEGLTVADGTQVDVSQPVYRLGDNATTVASGSDPAQALQIWTPDLYQQDPLKGVLTQRRGASLSLKAGTLNPTDAQRVTTVLTVGSGAVITVDPGQAISLGSIGQLTVNGTLNAWGGKVSLNEVGAVDPSQDVNGTGNSRSILLGDEALIDVAARAATAVDMRGQVYGQVSGGGSIVIGGGAINAAAGTATAADLFIVVSKGARLEASGTQANLDIAGQGRTLVASNGGSISLGSNNGLYLLGSFTARAGGQGAAGGSLSVVLQTPLYSLTGGTVPIATDRVLQVRELVLGQTADSGLAPDLNALVYGHGQLAADQVQTGGFDNLALYSQGFLSFNGNLDLRLGQSLQLYAGAFTLPENVSDNIHVHVAAPSLLLAGVQPPILSYDTSPVSTGGFSSSLLPSQADFSAEGAVIDLRNNVVFGSKGSFVKSRDDRAPVVQQVERRGFDQVNLTSQGDLRFLAGIPTGTATPSTQLITAGDLHLSAAQLYPETGSIAAVSAGAGDTLGTRLLTIGRTTQAIPQLPYSAFGSLTLLAPNIEQGGVVRAPLGLIQLGNGSTKRVELLPDSLTSVSGNGLIMPYGGTSDGQTYLYNGQNVTLYGQTGLSGGSGIGVVMGGQSVVVSAGATLDLSGGGDLLGAGFVSGRGGSTDARYNPLVQVNPNGTFVLPGLATNPVYAIVPGVQQVYAPSAGKSGAQDPVLGQQITIGAGVPGLAPGTYTLLPSTYALLPGAFRVELNGLAGVGTGAGAQAMRNGSWSTAGQLSIANTGIRNSVASQVILTSANVLRTYSQYNETSYDQFAIADAARLGVPRPMIEADAKSLQLNLVQGATGSAFSFDGIGRFGAAEGGHAGTVGVISSGGAIEVVSAGTLAPASFVGVTVDDRSLNALGAASLMIGGMPAISYGQGGNYIGLGSNLSSSVVLRSGAKLAAPEVLLVSSGGAITVEQGASINTLGMGPTAYDASQGYIYDLTTVGFPSTTRYNFLGVSNGLLQVLAPSLPGDAGIHVGVCSSASCTGQTELYSSGSIVVGTGNDFVLADNVRYGTRHLTLALSAINLGSDQALADAATRNLLPAGLSLNQSVLTRLLKGDTQYGAPALETLELAAHDSVNVYGSTTLDTYDPLTGKSLLSNLILSTPAIYGAGGAADVATIHTADLIWNGAANPAGNVVAGGAGTGSGRLNLQTETLEFGYGPYAQPNSVASLDRLLLGFSQVDISASQRVTANHKGSLSVYQSQGAYQAGSGFAYSGGNLNISTPLLTGEAGSVNTITVGGALNVTALSGTQTRTGGQGAKLSLNANSLALDTAVVLSSGQLNLTATQDLTLGDGAQIDMAGRAIKFNDVTQYSWGGDVTLKSITGNIYQAAGSRIDLSAHNNRAGQFTAQAVDPAEGLVDLQGSILGSSSGFYDAGGTYLPYLGGFANIQAQRLGANGAEDASFAALNQRLNAGQVYGARTFQIKQGNLTIGNDLKANAIVISLDNGSLLVNGKVDASGVQVGSINLSASQGLTLAGNAVLDAHGSGLQVDSQGKIIDSPNRAMVELNSGQELLTLASGATIDLRAGTGVALGSGPGQNDGRARGTLELDAPRLGGVSAGDIAIDASGNLAIRGARSIAVNGTWQYSDAPLGTDPAASGRPYQVITQSYLDGIDRQNSAFVDAALLNNNLLQNKLAGLYNATYGDVLHLRPAVEIVSATPGGDLVVQGDIDLSGYRYASLNPFTQKTGVYGSGEVGKLALRAGGDLNIYGSITDGFAPPPKTDDDTGWLLLSGIDFSGGNIVVPGAGVTLADGTRFPAGSTLNYDVPLRAVTLVSGTRLPVSVTLDQPLSLPAGTVLAAAVRDSNGNLLFAAGTLLTQAQNLPAGTQLDAGTLLSADTALRAFSWPKGVALPSIAGSSQSSTNVLTLNGDLALARGALIPSGTNVLLPGGVGSVQLRPEVAGRQGELWGIAPMLAEGSQSWSLRLVAGADTSAADNRVVQVSPVHGDLQLADSHYGMYRVGTPVYTAQGSLDAWGDLSMVGQPVDFVAIGWPTFCTDIPGDCGIDPNGPYTVKAGSSRFSVIRTGAADLELVSGGNLSMDSLFGVYTAGTSSSVTSANDPYNQPRALGPNGTVLSSGGDNLVNGGSDSVYRAWYPGGGGNLTLKVGGDLSGNIVLPTNNGITKPNGDTDHDSASTSDWLWRQGSGNVNTGTSPQPTAWWINFGTYAASLSAPPGVDQMLGFTGFGTLGGGNLNVQVAGSAGILAGMAGHDIGGDSVNPRTQGLVLAVGSTGRVAADGSVQVTGGGNLTLRVGGDLNPAATAAINNQATDDQNGVITNLRGHVVLDSTTVGALTLLYGSNDRQQAPGETRGYTAFTSTRSLAGGGLTLVPGDATFDLSTLGDLVVQTVSDPGRVVALNASPYLASDGSHGNGLSWFSLWTDHTAINLFSAGGNLTPVFAGAASDNAVVYPSILNGIAANGSIYYGDAANSNSAATVAAALTLAPSNKGQLQLLAANSIYGGNLTISQSSANPDALTTPERPAFVAQSSSGLPIAGSSNLSADGNQLFFGSVGPLFAFGPDSVSGQWNPDAEPARFYALTGDLIGVRTGRIVTYSVTSDSRYGQTWYEGGGPVWMQAGRDIVSSGSSPAGEVDYRSTYRTVGNLFVQNNPTDISLVSAGRDILYSNFNVAGPGTLVVSAGRNVLMADKTSITSLGAVVPGDSRPGASIVMQAGVGPNGPDYQAFIAPYLDPSNQAQAGTPLASQPGKVAKTYDTELVAWLGERYGFTGSVDEARAYYAALPPQQQDIFARSVYFAELKAAGREYNLVGGIRQGSYLRGRDAIAALFPEKDVAGNPILYQGAITLYGPSGVHTNFGGDIQMLAPGGGLVFGIEGAAPPSTAGIITQGQGDIQLFAQNNILLGQSRVMTTFGGSITAWSAAGDINAGRGSKTTVVYTPPKRVYDSWGNVSLSPAVPSTGAGIATLNPIPEVLPGDIDLIAPLGTIDAGEAGIRVSGNVNIAALQVVNAANIQVQGKSSGVPVVASVNTGAITSASAAATSAVQAADNVARQQQASARQNQPSVFSVQVLSFGQERLEPSGDGASRGTPNYNPDSPVQVLGAGTLSEQARARLTEEERGNLTL
ncbi:filamentous haemagglutinin family protein [Pseudomonas gingeri]|uniref:Filamentous hemagglutinin family protein n=1 Tax=Pseudomonas gingeri TaxID=117681 RepID=A0A7Y7WLU6_9PSED|nr:filamentous haemagglutinin family protein [Pseudomonas gingeri]NWB83889.1 filamentous hemagglutinin family protein [Pseudomonas gingeri]